MKKSPSEKCLLPLILFTTIIYFSYSCICWAYLAEQAKEYRLKAEKLQSEGRLDQAIVYYQKTIGLDKNCLSAYNGLAICFEKKGLFSRAKEYYYGALEIDPNYAPAHYNLGLFYENYGDIRRAIFHWQQRVRLGHPGDPGTIKARAKLKEYGPKELEEEDARQLNQYIMEQKKRTGLDKLLGRNKYITKEEKIQDYYLKGMQSYQEGDFRQTAEYFNKMIEALPFSN